MIELHPDLRGSGSEEHIRYANGLLLPKFVLLRTPELVEELLEMAYDIFHCPNRNKNKRSEKEVTKSVSKGGTMERGLCQIGGFIHNNAKFDHTVPETYNHDARDGDVKFEVKPFRKTYLSWSGDALKTFLNNAAGLDYLVAGISDKVGGVEYHGEFYLIARAPTFWKYCKASLTPGDIYYDHKEAGRYGQAIYRKAYA